MPAPKQRTKPKVGLEFVKEYKRKTYKLKVVRADAGVGYDVGGTVFTSPSTAAKSITKNEINGWKFWGMD
jgi:hypothetical protein